MLVLSGGVLLLAQVGLGGLTEGVLEVLLW